MLVAVMDDEVVHEPNRELSQTCHARKKLGNSDFALLDIVWVHSVEKSNLVIVDLHELMRMTPNSFGEDS